MQEENQTTAIEIPQEWRDLVARAGEKDKPVIMYYTSVSPMFTDGEKMIKKIRDVLRVFEENREEVTVLWHQDPWMKRYLPTDRPALWTQYQEIVDGFRAAGYGILDDTTEGDEAYFEEIQKTYPGPGPTPGEQRAMDFCSAYYGDGGYLANCFRNLGKPVMIQAMDILSETDE